MLSFHLSWSIKEIWGLTLKEILWITDQIEAESLMRSILTAQAFHNPNKLSERVAGRTNKLTLEQREDFKLKIAAKEFLRSKRGGK